MTGHARVAADAHDHLVQFYEDQSDLVRVVSGWLGETVARDGAAVLVATPAHVRAIKAALEDAGVDVAAATADERLQIRDAQQTLDTFMRDGHPEAAAFARVAGELLSTAAAGGRRVHVFGEMVALLWEEGNVAAAMALESLWNSALAVTPFSLLCAYPAQLVSGVGQSAALTGMCDLHSAVLGGGFVASAAPALDGEATAVATHALPADLSAPRAARQFVSSTLRSWHCDDIIDDARLLVSELATNAVEHARTSFTVTVSRSGSAVRIAVADSSGVELEGGAAGWLETSGRGLGLVAALARRWGHETSREGKIVWAQLEGDTA